jgi:GDP/UDP-N,N'-diacetylbacillosamine 2-epimerase (hydrolysing)
MKKICAISTTRADWSYLYWLCHDLQANDKFDLQIILPFNHHNFDAIAKEFKIYPTNAVKSIKDFGQFYSDCYKVMLDTRPDLIIIFSDRFEQLAAASAALLLNIPIAHLYGGETSLGCFDNEIRNAITQIATYHFTSINLYAKNVASIIDDRANWRYWDYHLNDDMRLINNTVRIFNVGSTGLDWIHRTKLLSKQELQQYVSIDLNQPFVIACMHSETKSLKNTTENMLNFIEALKNIDEQVLLISSNIDPGNEIINHIEDVAVSSMAVMSKPKKIHLVTNFDHIIYLSLLQYAEFMIGNSSSGIIESASFYLPTINVGNRQAGRLRNDNVFDCKCETEDILHAVDKAMEWNALVGKCENLYGDGKSTERIIKVLENVLQA